MSIPLSPTVHPVGAGLGGDETKFPISSVALCSKLELETGMMFLVVVVTTTSSSPGPQVVPLQEVVLRKVSLVVVCLAVNVRAYFDQFIWSWVGVPEEGTTA